MSTIRIACLAFVCLITTLVTAQTRIYVDADATGANDGSSWTDAFEDLQDALAAASTGDSLWIAAGSYFPTQGSNRDSSFEIVSGIALYGGFNGTENSLDARNITTNQTILSGDLNEDDGSNFANTADNSYSVVYGDMLSSSTRLDGLYIEGGNADDNTSGTDQSRRRSGGGFYNDGEAGSSLPSITNCIFRSNQAQAFGAAIYNNGSFGGNTDIEITHTQFIDNHCVISGGALHNDGRMSGQSNPYLYKCIFENNFADNSGGAIYNMGQGGDSSPEIVSCVFSSNETLTNTVSYAGAIYNLGINGGNSSPLIVNCLFNANHSFSGGAIYNLGLQGHTDPQITNCTFYENSAVTSAGTIYANAGSGTPQDTGTANVVVANSIFRNNTAAPFNGLIFRNNYGNITISHSNVDVATCADLNSGPGNPVVCGNGMQYNVDPVFVDPLAANFQLQGNSPCLNQGDDSAISAYPLDLLENTRLYSTVDFGPFEYQSAPLPIELLSFSARLAGHKVELNWATASETNNAYFTIERSADGRQFEVVEKIAGAGTASTVHQYASTDPFPFNGKTYYRLKQTDFDGQYSYSHIEVVYQQISPSTAFPNPVQDEAFVALQNFDAGQYLYKVIDTNGRLKLEGQLEVGMANQLVVIKGFEQLQAGSYFIQIGNEQLISTTIRIVKAGDQ